ncbi:MAG: PQQ-binding-like beta-propeller repeat protein [Rhodospirillaceae bacterium]|jgi:outer membrane protein assembly factor BamB|nr:PQQ-binding-like beta-propeller repeat protein [Rhodospirillaceae bacterium]MBT3884814.1 PQQ-binding-like beta-propeller repeat protein [Rhodospirillaceae bacterium]MBT4114878.1 PQQ-binding-like beta-propeller repeat protein [Rhodospirillaceae bacterium]MBT4671259.1 PQQ-binding-like beta-propeller repeat protein [Rhodospirillaceae bacterium]MBT4718221.1 PQQ-binding-like beta-propeller repeat protein [Rhodospirillaceae bacterium]
MKLLPSNSAHRAASVLVLTFALAACDTFLGAPEKPPLPGERISILLHQQTLSADAAAQSQNIQLPAPQPNASWPQAGGFANHAMHHLQVGKDLQRAWTVSVGEGNTDSEKITSQPIIGGGMAFVIDSESRLGAFDAKTGDDLWEVDLPPEEEDDGFFGGGLAYEAGRVYATTGFGEVIALEAKTGKIFWRRNLAAPMRSAPTVRENRVYAVTATNKLFALNGDTGETIWSHSGIEEATNLLGGGSPAVDGGVIVVPYSSGEVFALRVENGLELWNDSLSDARRVQGAISISAIRGRSIIDRGLVFAVSNSGLLVAINLRTGRRLWDRNVGSIESPWIAGDYLYVLSDDSELIAVNRRNGQINWVTGMPQWEDPEDKDGRIDWTGPILASDRLILANTLGEAYAVSPYTGRILGKVDVPDGVSITPIVAQNTLYFLTDDAELVAYR